MLEIKTKKILRNGEMVIINASDFDPKVHQPFDEKNAEAEAEAQRIIDEAKKANKK